MAVDSIRGVFWNLKNQDRSRLVASLAKQRKLNLIVLAESPVSDADLLAVLNKGRDIRYSCPESDCPRLQVVSGADELDLSEAYADISGRLTIRKLIWRQIEFLFAAVHCISKLNWQDDDQHAEVQVLADQIRYWEETQGHRRTILVGDLNMNPFERGVTGATGLHGMMSKVDIAEGIRTIQARDYPFFYNPMWGHFGDRTPGPPGTYFCRTATPLSYDWNMFDQFMVRPDVLEHAAEEVEIVSRIRRINLLNARGRPDDAVGSDHLPVFFGLTARGDKDVGHDT